MSFDDYVSFRVDTAIKRGEPAKIHDALIKAGEIYTVSAEEASKALKEMAFYNYDDCINEG